MDASHCICMEKIQPRIMVATFIGNHSTTVISCYSPTNVCEETGLIAFYNELFCLIRRIPKHNVFVIGGDKNAQIGKNVNNNFSLHNSSNRNGEHITDFTQENRLTCLNTEKNNINALRKIPLCHQLLVKLYHYCFSRMDLAIKSSKMLSWPWHKNYV